ncbi:MAG: hypothetical protein ACKO0M_19210 [Cyanobium sp.]
MTHFTPSTSTPQPPSKVELVACSSGWLAVSLNLGCQGWGYVYQRRWGAFWIGGVLAMGSAIGLAVGGYLLGSSLTIPGRPEAEEAHLDMAPIAAVIGGYAGFLAVGVGSAVEAGLAVNRSRRLLAAPRPQPD